MSVGNLVINNLEGIQPVWINPGDNTVSALGLIDIPPIKGIKQTTSGGGWITSTTEVKLVKSPIGVLVNHLGDFNNNNGWATLKIGQYTSNTFYRYDGSDTYFGVLDDANNTIATLYRYGSAYANITTIIKSYDIYDKSNSTVTIRYSASDISNPTTDFSSYGSEFNVTMYNNTSSYLNADYITSLTRYYCVKFEGVTNKKYFFPCICFHGVGKDDGNYRVRNAIYLWNFSTSAWNTIRGFNMTGGVTPNETGSVQYNPVGGSAISSNYIDNGIVYMKWDNEISHNTSNLGYIGLITYDKYNNWVTV